VPHGAGSPASRFAMKCGRSTAGVKRQPGRPKNRRARIIAACPHEDLGFRPRPFQRQQTRAHQHRCRRPAFAAPAKQTSAQAPRPGGAVNLDCRRTATWPTIWLSSWARSGTARCPAIRFSLRTDLPSARCPKAASFSFAIHMSSAWPADPGAHAVSHLAGRNRRAIQEDRRRSRPFAGPLQRS